MNIDDTVRSILEWFTAHPNTTVMIAAPFMHLFGMYAFIRGFRLTTRLYGLPWYERAMCAFESFALTLNGGLLIVVGIACSLAPGNHLRLNTSILLTFAFVSFAGAFVILRMLMRITTGKTPKQYMLGF